MQTQLPGVSLVMPVKMSFVVTWLSPLYTH